MAGADLFHHTSTVGQGTTITGRILYTLSPTTPGTPWLECSQDHRSMQCTTSSTLSISLSPR